MQEASPHNRSIQSLSAWQVEFSSKQIGFDGHPFSSSPENITSPSHSIGSYCKHVAQSSAHDSSSFSSHILFPHILTLTLTFSRLSGLAWHIPDMQYNSTLLSIDPFPSGTLTAS